MATIIFEKSNSNIKKPMHLKKSIFIIYCPRAVKIEPATSIKIDTEIVVFYHKTQSGMLHRYFEGMKLMKFTAKNNVCG